MIKGAIGEIIANGMARSTVGTRSRMSWRFTQGPGRNMITAAIMARLTVAGDTRVIED